MPKKTTKRKIISHQFKYDNWKTLLKETQKQFDNSTAPVSCSNCVRPDETVYPYVLFTSDNILTACLCDTCAKQHALKLDPTSSTITYTEMNIKFSASFDKLFKK